MKTIHTDIARIGMGCWAIGGPFTAGTESWGYGHADDEQSKQTIHAALDAGIQLFDTAPAYGAGHSERLLGHALKGRHDAVIVTKLGLAIDESKRQILGEQTEPDSVAVAIEGSLERLQRERIDVMLLHLNTLSVEKAEGIFAELEKAVQAGKVGTFGWSTDFPNSIEQTAHGEFYNVVEHGMNIFMDVPTIQNTVRKHDLTALIRSPLAMGVLTGKYGPDSVQPENDIRSTDAHWMEYFDKGRPSADYLANLNALRELLQSDGRTLAQGALCWLLAKETFNVPVPGARTPEQAIENAGAIQFGPLDDNAMQEIERLLVRAPEGEPRER